MIIRLLAVLGLTTFAPALWADALTDDVQRQSLNVSTIVVFVAFVGVTLCIIYWTSKCNHSTTDYHAVDGRVTGFQNDPAIIGDYTSAASFLGISALVFTPGYDGLTYSTGLLIGWPVILFLITERLRNLGEYTFADVTSYRLKQRQIHTLSVCDSLVVVAFYLIAQMVGANRLIELLFGLNYHVAMVLMGVLMVLYVSFDSMLAATWVQIIKVMLLLSGVSFTAIVALKHVNLGTSMLFSEAIKVHPKDETIMNPGGLVKDPISAFSLGLALMSDTARLLYILIRFFTVSDAKGACKSVLYAISFTGYFYILTFVIGFGATLPVSTNPDFKSATGALIGGNNVAAVHPADAVGSSLLLDFISTMTLAATLAMVAGLILVGASTVSHDLYASVFKDGRVSGEDELRTSKMTTMTLGVAAIVFGTLFEKQNIAFMVGLAFSIAASCNFPALLLSMYREKLTTHGAMIGGWMGLITAMDLIVLGPTIWVQILSYEKAIYPYKCLALFSMIVTSVGIWLFSVTDRSTAIDEERTRFFPQFIRPQIGLSASGAVTR